MRFNLSATALLAMAVSALAAEPTSDFDPVYTPEKNEVVPAGSDYKITWDAKDKYADATISISLIGGASQGKQMPLMDLASGVDNSAGEYTWSVDGSLGAEKVYGLKLTLESDPDVFQYSNPFQIKADGSKGDGSTKTLTTSHGVKTVMLSTTTKTPTTTAEPTTSSAEPTTTAVVNTTTCANTTMATKTTPTTSVVLPTLTSEPVTEPTPEPTATGPGAVPTPTGAASHAAGSVALVGGVVMAILAL